MRRRPAACPSESDLRKSFAIEIEFAKHVSIALRARPNCARRRACIEIHALKPYDGSNESSVCHEIHDF